MKRAVALSVVITAILLGPGAGAQQVTSPEELLGRLRTAGSVAMEGAEDPSPARMQAVQDALGLPVIVRIDGSDVSIPPDPVIARLSGDEAEDFRLAMERVEALRASLERAMAADPVDPEDVETALTEAYRGVVQVDPGIVERIRRAIAEAIQNVLTRLFSFRGAGTVFAWAVLLGLGVLVFWLIRRLRLVPETTMEAVRSGSGTDACRLGRSRRGGGSRGRLPRRRARVLSGTAGHAVGSRAPDRRARAHRRRVSIDRAERPSRTVRRGGRGDRNVRTGGVRRCRARGGRRRHAAEGRRAREVRVSRRVGIVWLAIVVLLLALRRADAARGVGGVHARAAPVPHRLGHRGLGGGLASGAGRHLPPPPRSPNTR